MITVDDMFPCYNFDSGAAFSKANGPELWVMLLEKAYAKIYGNYEKITNGMSGKAIHDLTGAPYENMDIIPQNANRIYNYLLKAYKSNYAITCASQEYSTFEFSGI